MSPSSTIETDFIPTPFSAVQHNVDQLIEIVDRYDLHANGELRCALENLRRRTAAQQLTLAILSDSRESKSRVIHALLNTTLADASIPPSTVACTHLAYGLETECAVTMTNNLTARLPLEQLAAFLSEKVPAASLKKVLVRFPNAALKNGLVVIDTPELSGNQEALVSWTAAALADADACVFAANAGEGLKENVIAFLRRVQGKSDKFFFVLESAATLSDAEQERSFDLITHALEGHCGLTKPRVALLSSVVAEWSEEMQGKGRSELCPTELLNQAKLPAQAKLLEFARIHWQSSISKEVARVAGLAFAQADGALRLRDTPPLRRAKLRRGVKALHGIEQQSAALARASDRVMRSVAEPPTKATGGEPIESVRPVEAAPSVADQSAPVISAKDIGAEEPVPTLSGAVPSTATSLAEEGVPRPLEDRAQASSFSALSPRAAEAALPIAPATGTLALHAEEPHFPAAQQTSLLPGSFLFESFLPGSFLPGSFLPGSEGGSFAAAAESHQTHWQPAGAPIYTNNIPQKMTAFAGEPVTSWIAPRAAVSPQREPMLPACAPARAVPRRAVPRIVAAAPAPERAPEPAPEPASEPASLPATPLPPARSEASTPLPVPERVVRAPALEPAPESAKLPATPPSPVANQAPAPSPASEPVGPVRAQPAREMPILRWAYEDDEEERTGSDAGTMVWRAAGLVAVAAIAWVLFVTVRPRIDQPTAAHPNAAQTAAMAVPPPLPQEMSQQEETKSGTPPTRDPQPAAGYRTGQSFPPPALPNGQSESLGGHGRSSAAPSAMAIANASGVESATAYYAGHPQSDAALESALDRWVDSSRSGNIQAEVACYAPFVETYFNSRHVTRKQVENAKELAWRRTAGDEKYRITPVSISDESNGRKTVLLQKDWITPTPRGITTVGSEIEKLVFAKMEGQWKIVDEQDVKLAKLRRE